MQIFVSYAREDEEFAARLTQDLKRQGANVWFDMTDAPMDSEENWEQSVHRALTHSDVMLLVLSPDALEHHYVENDWTSFIEEGRPVVIAVAECCVDIPEQLQRRQIVDFTGKYEDSFHRLQLLLMDQAARLSSSKWHQHPPDEED